MLIGVLLGTSATALAKIIPWNAEVPSSLSAYSGNAQQLAELTGERILIYAHPTRHTQLPTLNNNAASKAQYYSAAVVLPVAEAQVEKLATLSQLSGVISDIKISQGTGATRFDPAG